MESNFRKRFQDRIQPGNFAEVFDTKIPINKSLKLTQIHNEPSPIQNGYLCRMTPLAKPRKLSFQQKIKAVYESSPPKNESQKQIGINTEIYSQKAPSVNFNQLRASWHKSTMSASFTEDHSNIISQNYNIASKIPVQNTIKIQNNGAYDTSEKDFISSKYVSFYASRNTTAGSEIGNNGNPYAVKDYMQVKKSDYITLGVLSQPIDVMRRKTETVKKGTQKP
ncbi:unnamed protein product [Blepharisma stoltei]|uniref:Uncharacterized protein n=1 Tax=Blepharisma stoltei TaxID=1481888 RepID=A0AAU9K2C2_9CILI|nr:unnamed protein product [Blepharisma stoltei]